MSLTDLQKGYLALSRSKLIQLRDEVPLVEAALRVNEILDYLWYVDAYEDH